MHILPLLFITYFLVADKKFDASNQRTKDPY